MVWRLGRPKEYAVITVKGQVSRWKTDKENLLYTPSYQESMSMITDLSVMAFNLLIREEPLSTL
jgi:hypothetical protein